MSNDFLNQWLYSSRFTTFFQDFAQWNSEAAHTLLLKREYDDLFKGTNADIYIPLWASICKRADGNLLDETTLKVIQEYHRFGYAAVEMDGNPPDFIGQQFRYLSYLFACAMHEEGMERSSGTYRREIQHFISEYLLDTVSVVADGIRAHTKIELFLDVADEMTAFIQGTLPDITTDAAPDAFRDVLACYEHYLSGAAEPITDEEAHIVLTGGRNNCGGKCSISTTVQDGCITALETGCGIGDPQVRACVRGRGYRKTYLTGQRLRYPMRRIGERGEGRFERISWEEAADILAREMKRIKAAYGPGSRYVNYGIGVAATIRPDFLMKRLLGLDGGYLGFYGSYSFACAQYVTPYIYGDKFSGNSVEDLLNTKLLILWGHNPSETNFGSQRNYLTALAKEKGVRIIVIDPRQSDTAISIADEWIGIRPSTDGALADAMAYVIWSENLQDQDFMDRFCIGFDEDHMPDGVPENSSYHSYILGKQDGIPKSPEWAEGITGVPADTIRRLAREYATTKPACLLPGLGNQRIGNGEQTVRAMAALACMTGNIGIPGGCAGGTGFVQEEPAPVYPIGTNPYPGSISCFLWSTAIEDGINMTRQRDNVQGMERLDSSVKMMFNLAGNALINQHSDINRTVRILKDTSMCELIVCSDVFMTPSAKFADLLLPAPSFLEDDNIAPPWRVGHYLLCNNRVIQPLFGCQNEYYWIGETAKRLGLWDAWSEGRTEPIQWLEHLYNNVRQKNPELPEFAQFQANGGHTYQNPATYIAYAKQINDPEHHKFSTPSGKIEIFSKQLYDMGKPEEIPAIPSYLPCPEGPSDPLIRKFPLQLIGWHTKRRCHSIHDNNPWMEELEPQRVWIHPDDAAARGITDGALADIFNDRGKVCIPAKVTDRIIQGVVAMPQGAWYTPDASGTDRRGSINVLTSARPTPLAKGNPQHTNLVEVAALRQDPDEK